MARLARLMICATMLVAAACGGPTPAGEAPRAAHSSNDRITFEEIQRGHWASAYDLVESLRPRWLRSHGPDTILGQPVVVQVHLDENRLGGVQELRTIAVNDIESIEWVDPVSAASRWGSDHANGAIIVTTRTR